jgi:tetratricopeptide (TPR) repeat protein
MTDSDQQPVIYTYLKKFQEDPTSRVFAPLAEAYRKAGLIDEAIEIAREGLRVHPSFIGGRVALARALFDKRSYNEVITELTSVVRDVPDNLVAQRLMAEACLMTGDVSGALLAYKMLLYFAPEDRETSQIVQELETQAYEAGALLLRTDSSPDPVMHYDVRSAILAIDDDPVYKRKRWIGKIELMQGLLQRVERFRTQSSA